MIIPEHLKELFEETPQSRKDWEELLPEHPNLGATTWTPGKVKELDQLFDKHWDSCDDCRGNQLCDTAKGLLSTSVDAAVEYSWQEDFDPNYFGQ